MSVVYRAAVTALDGSTELPAGFTVSAPASPDGSFLIAPPGGGVFAALGLLDIRELERIRTGREPLVDDYVVARVAAFDANAAPGDVTYSIADVNLEPGTPHDLTAGVVIDTTSDPLGDDPRFVSYVSNQLRVLGATAGPFAIEFVILPLPKEACCLEPQVVVSGGPP